MRRSVSLLAASFSVLLACAGSETPAVPAKPELLATVSGFAIPESVRHDPGRDVLYVSNVTGNPQAKDNTGFISRARTDGTVDSLRFNAGGRGGVTLPGAGCSCPCWKRTRC
jgi:hypothetical protein